MYFERKVLKMIWKSVNIKNNILNYVSKLAPLGGCQLLEMLLEARERRKSKDSSNSPPVATVFKGSKLNGRFRGMSMHKILIPPTTTTVCIV